MAKTPKKAADYLSLRVNAQLKDDFYNLCKREGTMAGRVIKLFAKQFSENCNMQFSPTGDRSYSDDDQIRISVFIEAENRQRFSAACEEYGLPMSSIVRSFMDDCVTNNRLPFNT